MARDEDKFCRRHPRASHAVSSHSPAHTHSLSGLRALCLTVCATLVCVCVCVGEETRNQKRIKNKQQCEQANERRQRRRISRHYSGNAKKCQQTCQMKAATTRTHARTHTHSHAEIETFFFCAREKDKAFPLYQITKGQSKQLQSAFAVIVENAHVCGACHRISRTIVIDINIGIV